MQKMTMKQLKDRLRECTQDELINLVAQIYKGNTSVAEYINATFADEYFMEELLQEKKNKMWRKFFPGRAVYSPPIREAKKLVTDFQKVCKDTRLVLDMQLYYVECGVEYTNTYGDLSGIFYSSMETMFAKVTESIQEQNSKELFDYFAERMEKVVQKARNIGWGFYDYLNNTLCALKQIYG